MNQRVVDADNGRAMDHAAYPWRHLGELLVDDDVVTPLELDRALVEQRQGGRRLGEILVARGALTGAELTQALARQHGVELREAEGARPAAGAAVEPSAPVAAGPWRSLGLLLLQKGLVNAVSLQEALAEQRRHPSRRLGEILVERGLLSPPTLGSVLAEQHGVSVETELVGADSRATEAADTAGYEVEVVDEAGFPAYLVHVAPSLLDAADFACDYIDAESPVAVEIKRRDGRDCETVWAYSQEEAAVASSKSLVETFGFDPTRWGV